MAGITTERWRVLSPYLDQALDLEVDELEPWLASLRREDASLAEDLQGLLDERERLKESGFLEGTADPVEPPPSLAGLRIGAYTLVSPIGRGGMGTVWLAERSDGRFERNAAVKLLNTALIGRAGEERFTHEGRLLARLTHPNIAHLIDAGVTSMGQPYLVLEFVDGEHIDDYCTRHELGLEARLQLFIDVLEAVAHAHNNLIVHRDIKPSNVLVRGDGVVKLLDFGIAKLLDNDGDGDGPPLTVAGTRALTPEYAAPEQLTGGAITTATDVHALGVLLYVLLGGPHPVAGSESAADLVKVIVETEPARLSEVAPNGKAFRGDLDNILAKALKKRPAERYASVTAFADDLRRYLRHEPVSARPDTLAYRTTKFVRRRARAVAMTTTVVVLMTALIAFYTARLASERDRARLEADKSARVSELLTSLLTGADPYATRDREPTVGNILEAGAERVRTELADQPELRAEMLNVIGRVYQRLGMLDTAKPLLEEALSIGRHTTAGDTARLAQSLNELGILQRERGDLTSAVPLLEEALAMRRRLLGNDDKDVAVTLVELGRACVDAGMNDRAEPLFREALDTRQKIFGDTHRETSTSQAELALLLRGRGDLAGAEPLFRHALETSRTVLGDDHPNVGAGWNNLGLLLLDQGDYAGAEPMFRRALAIRRQHFGDRHHSLNINMSNLAASLREQGKYAEAASLVEEALVLAREGPGDNDAAIGRLSFSLGSVHLLRRNPVAAEQLLRDALHRQQRTMPPDDWRLASTKSALAAALTALARYDEAERLLIEASATLKDVPGRQGREAAATRERILALSNARKDAREPRATFKSATAIGSRPEAPAAQVQSRQR
jgi:serine/threonine protein kinase/Tfp pilus assembly protein PilF